MSESLPELFAENMKRLLGEAYGDFAASFHEGRKNALRVNRLRVLDGNFETNAPFPVKRVPWTDNGYYVDYRDRPGQHPWYRAGVYYLQEPSAMAPAQILPVSPGDRVLDLCAAPGGKATEIGARLAGEGILIANEISASRVRALERNIELFGIRNCVVTNEAPAKLAQRFPAYFDRILVDAPCSGEGMFRKDPDAAAAWSAEKVEACAAIQREIILHAADMLQPSGYMVYSTCTFEPAENELIIAGLLRERPEMELVEIPCSGGRETFSKAYTLQELADRGYAVIADTGALPDHSQYSYHIEKKRIEQSEDAWTDPTVETHTERPEDARSDHTEETRTERPEDARTDQTEKVLSEQSENARTEQTMDGRMDLSGAVRIWPHRAGGEGHFIALLRKKGSPDSGRGRSAKQKKGLNTLKKRDRIPRQERELIGQFLSGYASDLKIDMNRIEIRNGHVYEMPADCPDIRGLKFLRAGLYLGELKKNRFEPSQELALALPPAAEQPDRIHLRFSSEDDRLHAFLRGESIRVENSGENGWRVVCADVYPVGWGKLTGGVLKNHIPPSWRADR